MSQNSPEKANSELPARPTPASEAVDILVRADEPAFAVDEHAVIIAWNSALARLLDREESEVLGRRCYEVICGRDVFGNLLCQPGCSVAAMAHRREPVRRFELEIESSSGHQLRVGVSVMVIQGRSPDTLTIVHLLEPIEKQLQGCDPPLGCLADETPPHPSVRADPEHAGSDTSVLSRREIEILRLLEQGAATAEIAQHLYISVKTVRNHIQNIFNKLGAHNRREAIHTAHQTHCL